MNKENDDQLMNFFRELGENKTAPTEIKSAVFNHLDSIELVANVMDLFTLKFTNTQVDFLGTFENKENKK